MYKVETKNAAYAVKALNPEIMKRPGVMDNYRRAEELERILEDSGIPVVSALSFDGKKMVEMSERYFYVFNWQKGSITDWNNIALEQCEKAGNILGRIHRIDSQEGSFETVPCNIDFRNYLKESQGSEIHTVLKENIELLEYALKKLNEARAGLPSLQSICNDDMDPKNVMWFEGNPYVIDLECLDYGNPVTSVLNLSLQWSGTVIGNFKKDNLEAFYKGYLCAYDNGFRAYDSLYGISYTWVEWLEYNIRRALGMESSLEEDILLGKEEVRNTIGRIKYLAFIEKDVCEVLGNL